MCGGACARRRVSDWRRSAVSERNRRRRLLAHRSRPRPTNRDKRAVSPQTPRGAHPYKPPGDAPMTPRPGVCGGVTAHEKCFLKKSNAACVPAFSKPSRAARHHNFSFFIFHFFTSLPGPGLLRPFPCPARLWACLSLSPRCRRWSTPARQTGRRGVSVWFPRPARRWTGSCRPGS